MILLKKIPPAVWILLLLIALGVQTYFLFAAFADNKAIKASVKILEEDLLVKDVHAVQERKRLQEAINEQSGTYIVLLDALLELQKDKADKNSDHDKETDRIGRIRDVDSLRQLVSDRYTR